MAARNHRAFPEVDNATALVIIQLQLEDSRQLAANFQHHENNGEETDSEIALRLAREELERNAVILQDRQIATAIGRGVGLNAAREEALQAARVAEDTVRAAAVAPQPGK